MKERKVLQYFSQRSKRVWATSTLRLLCQVGRSSIEYDRFSICTNRKTTTHNRGFFFWKNLVEVNDCRWPNVYSIFHCGGAKAEFIRGPCSVSKTVILSEGVIARKCEESPPNEMRKLDNEITKRYEVFLNAVWMNQHLNILVVSQREVGKVLIRFLVKPVSSKIEYIKTDKLVHPTLKWKKAIEGRFYNGATTAYLFGNANLSLVVVRQFPAMMY